MIAYSATLDVPESTATQLVELLAAERMRRGCGLGARAASCWTHAVLILRWFREDTRVATLARDAGVSIATAYRYLHEGIDVLAARAPDLHEVLRRGKDAGWSNVTVDGTLIESDRCRTKNPESGHDLWFSGKHRHHGGNIQVVCDPDGFPVYVSPVEPGSTHDITAARANGVLGALHWAAAALGLPTLADKGYDGAGIGVHTPTKGTRLHWKNQARNELLSCLRAQGERGNAILKTRWRALTRIRLCPQRIGPIAAAALVLTTWEKPIR